MGTTSIVVEMVIIGFQVLVWITLITFAFFGYDWIHVSKLKDWTTIISVALVGISYTLGIVFDSFVGTLFAPWESRSWRWSREKHSISPGVMRAYIMATNADASQELTKRGNRSSLVRATSLNLVLITLSSLVFVLNQFGFSWKLYILIVVFSILLTGLTILTWLRTVQGNYFYLSEVYNALLENQKSKSQSHSG